MVGLIELNTFITRVKMPDFFGDLIECRDRQPDRTGEYLTWDGEIFMCQQYVKSGDFWETDVDENYVTHWCPLPDKPEK